MKQSKCLWLGEANASVVLNNWGTEALSFQRDQQVGIIVQSCVVAQDDPEWEEEFDTQVWLCEVVSPEIATTRCQELQKQLVFGDHLFPQERQHLEELQLTHNGVFALTDYELGETDLVTHSIDTGNSAPVKSLPRRLPYVLRQKLEVEM